MSKTEQRRKSLIYSIRTRKDRAIQTQSLCSDEEPLPKRRITSSRLGDLVGFHLLIMNTNSSTLIVARFSEDLEWVAQIPASSRIVVYNKGKQNVPSEVRARIERVEERRNFGREAETYLHHLLSSREATGLEGITIFCQGDPLSHSPDFLRLLQHSDEWADIQPLSVQWLDQHNVPPDSLLVRETDEFIHGARVRTEVYSLYTWNATRFVDDGAIRIGRDYLSGHGLPAGTNIAAHFLHSAGWHELAEQAAAAEFGQFAYGGIFAVRNERLSAIPLPVLERLHMMSRAHPLYPWIFERLWLHLFGLPFLPAVARQAMPRQEMSLA